MATSLFFAQVLLFVAAVSTPSLALNILYPFYPYPGQSWLDMASLIKSNGKVTFTLVINVKNGPGSNSNALYAAGIQKLTVLPNVKLLGYIDTSNGNCFNWAKASAACASKSGPNKVSDVYTQMANWVKFYGAKNINGFYLDNFLPYGGQAAKSTAATGSVLQDYSAIYKFAKKTYPSSMVVGNAGLLSPSFKPTGVKVADMLAVEHGVRNILADPSDATQASMAHIPSGYGKALLVKKIMGPVPGAKQQISQLVGLAKKWGATHFMAVREYTDFPSDLMPYLLSLVK